MKILFFSDIHGNFEHLSKLLAKEALQSVDWLINAGDFFYGYSLPTQANKQKLAQLINSHKAPQLNVLGNTDNPHDAKFFSYGAEEASAHLILNDISITLSHGHLKPLRSLWRPNLATFHILAQGHTHVAEIKVVDNFIYLNPGSLSSSRSHLPESYALLDNKRLTVLALSNDEPLLSYNLSTT
jgi:uncharacterized protein